MKIFIGLLLGFWASALVAADQPNILFIIADDASRDSFGAYGCQYVKTPGFDRIAREGVLFTQAYNCNPKCAPARACLLTGRYSWQLEEACNHNPFCLKSGSFTLICLRNMAMQLDSPVKDGGQVSGRPKMLAKAVRRITQQGTLESASEEAAV